MKYSDLQVGDVVVIDYYDSATTPMRLYTWLRSKEDDYFAATDLWAEFGPSYLDTDWQLADEKNYIIVKVAFNVPDPTKMLQQLHPELFI